MPLGFDCMCMIFFILSIRTNAMKVEAVFPGQKIIVSETFGVMEVS